MAEKKSTQKKSTKKSTTQKKSTASTKGTTVKKETAPKEAPAKEKTAVSTEPDIQIDDNTKKLVAEVVEAVVSTEGEHTSTMKKIVEALGTLGTLELTEESFQKALSITSEIEKVQPYNARYVANLSRSIVVIGTFTIRPYTIVDLNVVFPDEAERNRFKRNPQFIEAVRRGMIRVYRSLTPDKLQKIMEKTKDRPKNILEIAQKLGIQGSAELHQLIKKDPNTEEFFKKMWAEIRKETGVEGVQMPEGTGELL